MVHRRIGKFFSREQRDKRKTERFARESQRLARETALEERRAGLRAAQQKSRPKGGRVVRGGAVQGFMGFAQDFARRQEQRPSSPVLRERPRVAARGQTFFDQFGRPISVRNAPAVRRRRKKRRKGVQQPMFGMRRI